jgi:ribosomal protein S14
MIEYNRSMINLNDFIYIGRNSDSKRYRSHCDSCGKDRGYGMKSRAATLCRRCAHAGNCYFDHSDLEFRENMSKAKSGVSTWNKGTSKYSNEQRTLRCNLSSAIRIRLNDRSSSKKGESYLKKLGYSIEELAQHIESNFHSNPQTGELMTWDNYGLHGWHIDHRTPDSWFTYKSMDDEGFKKSWALTNLQPKWAIDNLSKGNHYVD